MTPPASAADRSPLTGGTPPPATGPVGADDVRGRLRLAASWRLLKPYWFSEDRKAALGLLALIVALNLASVAAAVWFNSWYRLFYNSLEQRDFPVFKTLLLQFFFIAMVAIALAVATRFYTMRLQMRWRTWMTRHVLNRWMAHQAYYRIEQTRSADNPDQRIAEDIRSLTSDSLTLSLGLLSSVVTLVSFIAILWAVSGPLAFSLGGHAVTIPGYMVWVALLYAVAGSWITHRIGKPLIGLFFRQEQAEAGFRYGLVRLRENAEGVALYAGEPTENGLLRGRFDMVRDNWHWLMVYTRRLVFVNTSYAQVAIIFPMMVAAPRYFSKQITLGDLMQVNSAFGQVQGALSWFVDSYASLVNWQASANRLLDLQESIEAAERDEAARDGRAGIAVVDEATDAVALRGLVLNVPGHAGGAPLTAPFSMAVAPGERWLVSGPSGSGKSVLFRALAGIWPYGEGQVAHPAGKRLLFLPQKSYVPSGTLADALCYPEAGSSHGEATLRAVLHDCRLGALEGRLGEVDNWSLRLSPGEQQRLAFGRAILQQPDYLFLDEATSALDEETEAAMYALLAERLPRAALVSIAHRSTVARWHGHQVRYLPTAGGSVAPFAPVVVDSVG
ncbi:MAG: ABC transporter ATP-binding protein/permease [Pseudomonadota bacterium]